MGAFRSNRKSALGKAKKLLNMQGDFAMLGIIGAMDIEILEIQKRIKNPVITETASCRFVCGYIGSVMVCAAMCSPGKVNAALCAQAMIDNFKPDKIINTGVGCSLRSDVAVKNIVVASDVCEYDIDISALGEPRGFINGLNKIKIETDFEISNTLARIAINSGEKIHRGTVASGDTFIASAELKAFIAKEFSAVCGGMEGAAIGHACAMNNVPFGVLRAISDGADNGAPMSFEEFTVLAVKNSIAIILDFLTN